MGPFLGGLGVSRKPGQAVPVPPVPTHPCCAPPHPLLAGGSSQDILPSSSDFFVWNPFPKMLSLEIKALGSPQGLTVKGTHIPVPRGLSNGDIIAPPPQRAGGGRADKVGQNQVTFPFKCLLCD